MLAERLDKAWSARLGSTAIDPVMRFSDEGLVLGAGTIVAPSAGSSGDIKINPLEPRLRALLAAAHLGRPSAGALAHLKKAAERWNEGQDALAVMHLALSRLDRLRQPEADAHRLFLADGLLNSGVEADAVIAAIETNASDFAGLHKYNPDQPRVPAGSDRTGGEWTSTGGGAPDTAPLQPVVLDGHAVKPLATAMTTPHQLTFTTFDGGPNDPAGWSGAFELDHPTTLGGVVIQKIETEIRQSGAAPLRPAPYWEALTYIPPGATSGGVKVDDSWSPPSDGSHGSETTKATAIFYEGLTLSTLPGAFRRGDPKAEAGLALFTSDDPKDLLPSPSSAPLVRKALYGIDVGGDELILITALPVQCKPGPGRLNLSRGDAQVFRRLT